LPYDTIARPPSSVFYDGASLSWASFQKKFAGDYLLAWIEIQDGSWGVDARAPLGTWVREFVYVPVSGNLTLREVTPDGKTHTKDLGMATPGYRYIWHQADAVGKHSSVISIGDVLSNEIDLTAF